MGASHGGNGDAVTACRRFTVETWTRTGNVAAISGHDWAGRESVVKAVRAARADGPCFATAEDGTMLYGEDSLGTWGDYA